MRPALMLNPSHLLMAIVVLATANAGATRVQQEPIGRLLLPAAAGADHLWFITGSSRTDGRYELRHHARNMRGPYLSAPVTILREPEALAASGSRVWMAMPAQEFGDEWKREVFTVEAVRQQDLQVYRHMPENRLGVAPSLPGEGALAGFVGAAEGPVALLVPHQHALLDRSSPNESEHRNSDPPRPRLLELRNEKWVELPLPELLPSRARFGLGAFGSARDQLAVIAAVPGEARARLYRQSPNGGWSVSELRLDLRRAVSFPTLDGRLAVVSLDRTDSPGLRLAYLRPTQVVEIASLAMPTGRWAIVGWRDGFRLIEYSTRGTIHVTPIDGVTGMAGERVAMTAQPLPLDRLWYLGLMLVVAVVAVLLAIMVRPSAQPKVKLPSGLVPLSAFPRLAALIIDLLPGAGLAIVLLRSPPVDLLRLPLTSASLDQAAPYFIMLIVFLLHTTMSELFTARTLGKAMMGGHVVSVDGGQPGAGAVIVRGFLKVLILLVPPLAVFALFNPYLQGFNDLVARTVVVRRAERSEEGAGED